jgi:hypothetical protein
MRNDTGFGLCSNIQQGAPSFDTIIFTSLAYVQTYIVQSILQCLWKHLCILLLGTLTGDTPHTQNVCFSMQAPWAHLGFLS